MPYIEFLPLTLSLFATAYVWFVTDMRKTRKRVLLALMIASLLLMFVPALQFHFLIPLILQVGISIWFLVYQQIRG